MSVLAKLAGFAVALVLVFAGAALAGGAHRRPTRGTDGSAADAGEGMAGGHGGSGAAPRPRPSAAWPSADGGLTLEPARDRATAGERFALTFRITGPTARPCATSTSSTRSACT